MPLLGIEPLPLFAHRDPRLNPRLRAFVERLQSLPESAQCQSPVSMLASFLAGRDPNVRGKMHEANPDSVRFWCCPPGPPALNVSTRHSPTRASSLSGIRIGGGSDTAVWTR